MKFPRNISYKPIYLDYASYCRKPPKQIGARRDALWDAAMPDRFTVLLTNFNYCSTALSSFIAVIYTVPLKTCVNAASRSRWM